jgi:hypothetical protein
MMNPLKMGSLAAFREGVRRVNGAPLVLAGAIATTFLIGLPLSIALRGMIAAHLGESLTADTVAAGANYDWWQEFTSQATGLGTTFVPAIIGFGAVLENISNLVDNQPMAATIAGAAAAWMVIWTFLSGGILDRYARQRPTRTHGFFSACGTNFWRFLRLGVLALAFYAWLFGPVHAWIFEDFFPWATRDLTVERTGFTIRLACYLVFVALLVTGNVMFDYARVRIVVEDRRSAFGALLAGIRFVRRNRGTLYLYLLNAAVFVLLALLYALAAPGAPGGGLSMWVTLAIGQLYIVGRHYVKLLFYASETAFFQGALAHAGYTAAPPVVWPESPAAEAIVNVDTTSVR